MKVLFLCNLAPGKLGAFEGFLSALGQRLRSEGDRLVVVFAGEPASDVANSLMESGVLWRTVERWQDPSGLARPWAIVGPSARLIRAEAPDVVAVHFGNELPVAVTMLICRGHAGRIPFVWHQRQQISDPATIVQSRLSRIRILSRFCAAMVPIYDGGKRSMELRGVCKSKIRVIKNGVSRFSRSNQKGWLHGQLRISPERRIVLNVSSLIERKRLDLTLEAFSSALESTDQGRDGALPALVLVGEGDRRVELMKLAENMGLSDNVFFLGHRLDVRDLMAESYVLMLSSDAEASPFAVIEAMSVGLPAIATDAGAVRELIVDGETGYVLCRGDGTGLGVRLQSLLKDPARRDRLATKASDRWFEHFTLDRMVQEHADLYRCLI